MSVASPVISHIDGAARRIYLLEGVDAFHWIEDIYREYLNRRSVEDLRKWFPFMTAHGNVPKSAVKGTPRYIKFLQGAKVVPFDENRLITVSGEAITDTPETDPDPFDTSTRVNPIKLYIEPSEAEIIYVSTGSGLTTEEHDKLMATPTKGEIANAVLDEVA